MMSVQSKAFTWDCTCTKAAQARKVLNCHLKQQKDGLWQHFPHYWRWYIAAISCLLTIREMEIKSSCSKSYVANTRRFFIPDKVQLHYWENLKFTGKWLRKLTAPLPGVSSCIGAVSCGVFEVTLVETVEVLAESFVVKVCLNFFNCLRYNSLKWAEG